MTTDTKSDSDLIRELADRLQELLLFIDGWTWLEDEKLRLSGNWAWASNKKVHDEAKPAVRSAGFAALASARERLAGVETGQEEARPVAWLRDQRGEYEGPETLDPFFVLGASKPRNFTHGATYSPLYAAPPARPVAPAGWKCVPVEPTEEMLRACVYNTDKDCEGDWSAAAGNYAAMLAASPAAPAPVAPAGWRDHVEQRLRSWRQSFVNCSGDQLALDDFMDQQSLDDLIDYVCDEWAGPASPAAPAAVALSEEQIEAAMNPCDDSEMGRHLRREFIASFMRVYKRLHGIKE